MFLRQPFVFLFFFEVLWPKSVHNLFWQLTFHTGLSLNSLLGIFRYFNYVRSTLSFCLGWCPFPWLLSLLRTPPSSHGRKCSSAVLPRCLKGLLLLGRRSTQTMLQFPHLCWGQEPPPPKERTKSPDFLPPTFNVALALHSLFLFSLKAHSPSWSASGALADRVQESVWCFLPPPRTPPHVTYSRDSQFSPLRYYTTRRPICLMLSVRVDRLARGSSVFPRACSRRLSRVIGVAPFLGIIFLDSPSGPPLFFPYNRQSP